MMDILSVFFFEAAVNCFKGNSGAIEFRTCDYLRNKYKLKLFLKRKKIRATRGNKKGKKVGGPNVTSHLKLVVEK